MDQALEFLRDHLVAFAHDDIEHGLRADDLAGGRDERRIPGVLTHARDLLEHFVKLVFLAGVLELLDHVGQHAARHLIQQRVGVDAQHLRVDLTVGDVLFAQLGKMLAHDVQLAQIKAGIVVGPLQSGDQTLGGHMRGAKRQRAHRGIDDVGAGLDALEDGHGSQTGGIVAVDVDGNADGLLQRLDKVVAGIGLEQTGHILDADGIGAHLFEGLGVLNEIFVGMHRAQGVADAGLNMRALLAGRLDGGLEVARVVQRVENTQDVDAVGNGLLHEILDGVVGIMAVAEHVLAAEQHLQLGVGHLTAQRAQALPRVFVQETDAGVKRGAAPAFHREVADFVHRLEDRQHLVDRHTGSQQRLVRVAQDDLSDLNGFLSQSYSPRFQTLPCAEHQFMLHSKSPELTVSPLLTLTLAMVPSCGAEISFSIFMASRISSVSPALTESPGLTRTSRILPGIGALTATAPALPAGAAAGAGAGAGAAGAAAAGAGAGAAAGAATAPPAVSSTVTS